MFQECRHILTSGYKCRAAAIKGKKFCFFHTKSLHPTNKLIAETGILLLPTVEDAGGVTMAINQVLRQYGKGNIDGQQAHVFFRGLQIAASLVRKAPADQLPGDTVREVCEDPIRGTIGPEKTGCDPEDCRKCSKRYSCRDCHLKDGEAEPNFVSFARLAGIEEARERELAARTRNPTG
jgi:hypothetical protein